ncbi:metallophosphoesterase [Paenibacillus alkalitolerans]|uniref:metallophosphoesterase n=1 Tax=Paenibacillus alkalitolerans TaxID=2799335 RepID=UPI0018F4E61A|nr:metallophosphoesterase [Paenibacillus alkalitolerans]
MTYLIIALTAIILVRLFYKAYKNTHDVVINRINIGGQDGESMTDTPSMRVLHLSDMHLENISISPGRLYDLLKNEQIDLIALTGDFLDRKRTITKLIPYLETLNRLNAKYGMYAVFGNHDYVLRRKNFARLRKVLNDHGCKTLQNENETIRVGGVSVNLIGIDDHSTKRSDLAASYTGVRDGYNLVLTHDPNVVLDMGRYSFDYLLSGHFHGGQICWPKPYHLIKMGKLVRLNMVKGLHYHNGKPFYISEGLGQTGVNIRVGSRPEITLHELSLSSRSDENNVSDVAV